MVQTHANDSHAASTFTDATGGNCTKAFCAANSLMHTELSQQKLELSNFLQTPSLQTTWKQLALPLPHNCMLDALMCGEGMTWALASLLRICIMHCMYSRVGDMKYPVSHPWGRMRLTKASNKLSPVSGFRTPWKERMEWRAKKLSGYPSFTPQLN